MQHYFLGFEMASSVVSHMLSIKIRCQVSGISPLQAFHLFDWFNLFNWLDLN